MVYEYLITLCKLIVALVTRHPQSLIYAALICLGTYLLWIIIALVFSFQRRFYAKSAKMYDFIKKQPNLTVCNDFMKKKSKKLSVGFGHGWSKFDNAKLGKPSNFISRNEALDSEVSGGLFNQGKSIMKSFIWISTIFLTVINVAFHGADNTFTFMLFAESLVLPIFYYIIMKIFYYLYTVIRQQLYKLDIDSFYELLDLLDEKFEKINSNNYEENNNLILNKLEELSSQIESLKNNKQKVVEKIEPQIIALNEVTEPNNFAESSEDVLTQNLESDNESNESDFEQSYTENFDEENIEEFDSTRSLEDDSINEVPENFSDMPYIDINNSYIINDDENTIEEEPDTTTQEIDEVETIEEQKSSYVEEIENEVSTAEVAEVAPTYAETTAEEDFDSKDLEETELESTSNIEKFNLDEFAVEQESDDSIEPEDIEDFENDDTQINDDDIEIDDDDFIYDDLEDDIEDDFVDATSDEINSDELANILENFNAKKTSTDTNIASDDDKITKRNSSVVENDSYDKNSLAIKTQAEKPLTKPAKAKTESKYKSKGKDDMSETLKKRGRPKKPVFDEEVTINTSAEFNAALARAEKLMRKSEEGLSASQSKRIEKELKMLMEAMNKYKENR